MRAVFSVESKPEFCGHAELPLQIIGFAMWAKGSFTAANEQLKFSFATETGVFVDRHKDNSS